MTWHIDENCFKDWSQSRFPPELNNMVQILSFCVVSSFYNVVEFLKWFDSLHVFLCYMSLPLFCHYLVWLTCFALLFGNSTKCNSTGLFYKQSECASLLFVLESIKHTSVWPHSIWTDIILIVTRRLRYREAVFIKTLSRIWKLESGIPQWFYRCFLNE